MRPSVLVFLVLSVIVAACGRGSQADRVVAKVGDRPITTPEFVEGYRALAAQDTSIHPGIEGRRAVLKSMVDRVLLEAAALEKYPAFNQSQKIRLAQFHKEELTRAFITAEVNQKIHVKEEDVRRAYDARDTKYRVRHIFCPTRAEAEAAVTMLRQGGSFNAVAAAYSKDTYTAPAGGETDWFVVARGPGNEFEAAVMKLAAGETSPITEVPSGFEIIRLEESAPNEARGTFVAEKREIDLVLQAREAERLRHELRRRLFDAYAVKVVADAPSFVAGWLGAAGEDRQVPAVSPADSARALVNLDGIDVSKLLAEGAFGDTAWAQQRTRGAMTLNDFALWLTLRPPDLWPDASESWSIEKALLDMTFDEVVLRETLAKGLHKTPEMARRFEERANLSRVMRFYNFDVTEQVQPTEAEIRAVYEEGKDRYVWPDRYVIRGFTSRDSMSAVGFAAALRAGESFNRAAARFAKDASASYTPSSAPDTLIADNAGDVKPALIALTAPGQVSGPLAWGVGYFSAFQLVELLPRGPMTFEQARVSAVRDAKTIGAEAKLNAILDELRRAHPVTIDESALEKVEIPAPAGSAGGAL